MLAAAVGDLRAAFLRHNDCAGTRSYGSPRFCIPLMCLIFTDDDLQDIQTIFDE